MKDLAVCLLIGLLGCVIRCLIHYQNARRKIAVTPGKDFSFKKYFDENTIQLCISLLTTVALVFIIPSLLEMFDYQNQWSKLVAFGCGVSSMELLTVVRNTINLKLKNFCLGLLMVAGLVSCATPEQKAVRKFNKLVAKYPFLVKRTSDTAYIWKYRPGFDKRDSILASVDPKMLERIADSLEADYNLLIQDYSDGMRDQKAYTDQERQELQAKVGALSSKLSAMAKERLRKCPEIVGFDTVQIDTLGVRGIAYMRDKMVYFQVTLNPDSSQSSIVVNSSNVVDSIELVMPWWEKLIGVAIMLLFIFLLFKFLDKRK